MRSKRGSGTNGVREQAATSREQPESPPYASDTGTAGGKRDEPQHGNREGYSLLPLGSTVPYSEPSFAPLQRAPFAQHPVWVTQYKDGETYAAGNYPNQGVAGEGLTKYAAPAESVDAKDLVLWYTAAMTHHPEVEEYPVMTTTSIGFRLAPSGFFASNPALDAPAQK
jgi:primary-amine oxidase